MHEGSGLCKETEKYERAGEDDVDLVCVNDPPHHD